MQGHYRAAAVADNLSSFPFAARLVSQNHGVAEVDVRSRWRPPAEGRTAAREL